MGMISSWDSEGLYFSGDLYFDDLIKEINVATHSIFFESYIFEKGVIADRVVSALVQAAQRGVKIKVLVDGIGSPNFGRDYFRILKDKGIGVRFFPSSAVDNWPIPWRFQKMVLATQHPASPFQPRQSSQTVPDR